MNPVKGKSLSKAKSRQGFARHFADNCLAMRSRRLSRVVTRVYQAVLRPLDITPSQLNLLAAIELMAPVSPAEVGRQLDLEKSTLSRNLSRMSANGWIRSAPTLELSPAGRSLLEQAAPLWCSAQERMENVLGPEAVRTVEDFVTRAQTAWPA